MFNYENGYCGEFQTHSLPRSLVMEWGEKKIYIYMIKREKDIKEREGKIWEEMLPAMKGSYFKLIAAKRVYSENQFYESPLSTKGSSMQPSNLKLTSKTMASALIHAGYHGHYPPTWGQRFHPGLNQIMVNACVFQISRFYNINKDIFV